MVWVVFALVVSLGAGSTVWGDNLSDIENIIISVDGVEPTAENISSGEYALHRDLILVTGGNASAPTSDFINWILSEEGQSIVADSGFVPVKTVERAVTASVGTINVVGSSTVMPLMVEFAEAYEKTNNITVNVMGGGSGKGLIDVETGNADIGMLSNDLKSDDLSLNYTSIAMDGVIIIVDKASGITDLSTVNISKIYKGEITNWAEVGGNDLKISPIVRETMSGTRGTLDSVVSEEFGISALELTNHYKGYSVMNSTGAMLFHAKGTNGCIGYVNLYGAQNL